MGACFHKALPKSLLLVGLDRAGKSCLLTWLEPPSAGVVCVAPTVGLRRTRIDWTSVEMGRVRFDVWDMAGHGRYRSLWSLYCAHVHAIMFVVDALDTPRLGVARQELWLLLHHKAFADRTVPVLVFLNKSEAATALSTRDAERALDLHQWKGPWRVEACSAVTGGGIEAGVRWLVTSLLEPLDVKL
ncbi:ADP ribosylation factor 79F [Achlya hypogyna]|uniref:ADP ribosylation factor 79F n=1 Tax=Achlya hypogyna TaxID=1202772 RepID=A0A1V9ZKC4_ACHHY|nr:ADP ribosylation factor 79F [Achlya hypogyna]